MKFNTKAIHGGQIKEKGYGAVMPPIYQTSTYSQTKPGEHLGYEYSRTHNPTRSALERSLASIENGKYGMAFSSGLSAIDAILKLFEPGDEIISTNDLYGGSYRLFDKVFKKFGLKFIFSDLQNIENISKLITVKTKMIWVETPTNPMMNLIDINSISNLCKDNKILLAVDNTFATPYLQKPLDLGADIVMHSATKYLAGHSDVILGALVVQDDKLAEKLARVGLHFECPPLKGDEGKITCEVMKHGGRFGKDTDTKPEDVINDDGISHLKDGGLKMSIEHMRNHNNTYKVYAKLI